MSLEGFTGPMFSGKSTMLMSRIERARLAGLTSILVKPNLDDRFIANRVCTHANMSAEALVVPGNDRGVEDIANLAGDNYSVVGVDEAQFFPCSIVTALLHLSDCGKRVFWAGLDMDAFGHPFGSVPMLMAVGGVTKMTAVCMGCGEDATHTWRHHGGNETIEVGEKDKYTALCRPCWRARGV